MGQAKMFPSKPPEKHSFWPHSTVSTGPSWPLNCGVTLDLQSQFRPVIHDWFDIELCHFLSRHWLWEIPHLESQFYNQKMKKKRTFTSWSSEPDSTRGSVGWNFTDRTPSRWLRRVYLWFQVLLELLKLPKIFQKFQKSKKTLHLSRGWAGRHH